MTSDRPTELLGRSFAVDVLGGRMKCEVRARSGSFDDLSSGYSGGIQARVRPRRRTLDLPGRPGATRTPKAQPSPPQEGYGFGERLQARGLMQSAAGLPTPALPDEMLLEGPGPGPCAHELRRQPGHAWPDQHKTIRALQSLELLVQIDPWMSQTARLAHYVIAPKMGVRGSGRPGRRPREV